MSGDGGRKFDGEKLRYDLIPPECEELLAAVLTYGAIKYDANNWQNLKDYEDRYYAALRRHENLRRMGETYDHESGLPHSAHMFTNAMFILWQDLHAAFGGDATKLSGYVRDILSHARDRLLANAVEKREEAANPN